MNFNISAWAIRQPAPSLVLFALLLLLGVSSFMSLPVGRTPNIDLPLINITISQAGAAPEELETDVTRLVENAVAGIAGIRHISSTITDGLSTTRVEFQLNVAPDTALFDVKSRVDALRSELPADIDAPIVSKVDTEGVELVTWQVSAPDRSLAELSWFIDDTVSQHLRGLPGVGDVVRRGGSEREIKVALDPDRLLSLGGTVGDVQDALQDSRIDLPAGHWNAADGRQPIRILARARSVAELADTPLPLKGHSLRLGDVARITDTNVEAETFLRRDGVQTAVAFSVFRARGADELAVARAVADALPALKALAPDITFTRIDETITPTRETFDAAMSTLFEGALLAIVVVFIFLRNWRATLIAAVSLPLAIIPTFWVLDLMGYTLNMLSLLGVTLVTGILVDDAIVEIENIERHLHMGKTPRQATFDATAEIGLAVMAISTSVAVVFAPVGFMGGVAGQYFKEFGLTVSVSVLFSLLVARLITPIMAANILRPSEKLQPQAEDAPISSDSRYAHALGWVVRHKWVVIALSVLGFVAALAAASQLPDDLVPQEETGRLVFAVEAPADFTLSQLNDRTDVMARLIRSELSDVAHVLVEGGVAPSGNRELRLATLIVHLKPRDERKSTQRQVQLAIRDLLRTQPDLRAWPVNSNLGREVEISVAAATPSRLREAASLVERKMQDMGLANVAVNSGFMRNEIHIAPRLTETSRLDITTTQIANTVRLAAVGGAELVLPKFKAEDRLVPIRVQLDASARQDIELLRALPVARVDGRPIPLSAIADIRWQGGPSSIERYDRQRRVLVGADLAGGATLGTALTGIRASEEVQALPPGVLIKPAGDGELLDEVMNGFVGALGLGLLLMFAVMVLLFSSLRQPLIILMSLPLALTGAILALYVTSTPINLPVLIGILMLMGIVAKNAILLVDFAKIAEDGGMSPADAIIHACRTRARPILMTTLAMVAGMLPSALGGAIGGGFRAPMAIVVIGGLLVATVLSLLTTPALFLAVESLYVRLMRGRGTSSPSASQSQP
ncbi:efflux RND transporter permease subunit [Martelella sp. FLE1502]